MVEDTLTGGELQNEAAKKKAAEREEYQKEEARIKAENDRQEKEETDRIETEEKTLKDKEKAAAKAREKEEDKHELVVVDVGVYIGKISTAEMDGAPRRLAGIRLMFEELGVDNYVEKVSFKGTESFVFKK